MGKLFPEATDALGMIGDLKKKVADRSGKFSSKVGAIYADYDERLTKAEGSLAKTLDAHAMDFESAVSEELSNVGKQISDASSEEAAPPVAAFPDATGH